MKNTITESQITNISIALTAMLASNGIFVGDNSQSNLKDCLEAFLKQDCAVSTIPDTITGNEDNVFELNFDIVSGSAKQQVLIFNPDYDQDSVIDGLISGALATTLAHDDGDTYIEEITSGKQVGLILSQAVDGEYEDYS